MPAKTGSGLLRIPERDDVTAEFAEILRQPAEIWEGMTRLLDTLLHRKECLSGKCRP